MDFAIQCKEIARIIAAGIALLFMMGGDVLETEAQKATTKYPSMAPLAEYLMDRNAEIALAKSAAPASISGDAEVLVLSRNGYETAIKGKNGFVCAVQRGWQAGSDDPDFWNAKLRAPICFNAAATHSQVPLMIRRAKLVLNGASKEQMFDAIKTALEKGELLVPEPGSMCYMMSKQGYLSDRDGRWHPHLMFFTPTVDPSAWGADMPGSPIIAFKDTQEKTTVFLVPLTHWSDGSPATSEAH